MRTTGRQSNWVLLLTGTLLVLGALLWTSTAPAQSIAYNLETTSVLQLKLPQSQAVTVEVSGPVGKVVVGNKDIADVQPVTSQSIYVVGRALGRTSINLFSPEGETIGLIAAEVTVDGNDLARAIRAAVPDSNVQVGSANGRVMLSGTVPDSQTMNKVLVVAAQYGSEQVVNTITLSGAQQVNLQVRILEAQRSAGRELGINWR